MSTTRIFTFAGCRLAAALFAFALGTVTVAAEATPSTEYQVKAVFLFRFLYFTQWPASAFGSPDAPVVIGIMGDDPFDGALDEAIAGEKLDNRRPIVARRVRTIEEARSCHIVFIANSERANVDRILQGLRTRPILTVSDIPGFARRGGTIGFYVEGGKVKFEINPAEAQRSGLQLSSQLLQGRTVSESRPSTSRPVVAGVRR